MSGADEGNKRSSSAMLSAIPEKLIRALPPAMTMLVVLNVIFLGVSTYVFSHNSDKRSEMLAKILDRCLEDHRQ